MATRRVKARVEIDGEAEYKRALSDLNQGNRVLGSEMQKLQAEFRGNAESTEFLTRKGELLERQLLQQRDKVQTLRAALANAAAQYGEADERTQEWTVKLNRAEAAQFELQHAIDENNAALQGQSGEMVGLGDAADQLAGKLGISIPDGAKQALNGMEGFSAGTVAAMAAAAAGVAALISVVKQLQELTLEAAANADELLTESMVTGLSTDTLQQLQYAENLIDVSAGTITGSLTKLTRNMDNARSGNERLAESFLRLGVPITDASGQLRSAEAVFYDTIDALGRIENGTERDAVAMELLGRSAQELNPLILQGTGRLRELAQEAEATGYVLDEYQLKRLGEVDDAYQQMQLQIEATKKELALEFAPASQAAMELFGKAVKAGGELLERSGLVDSLALILSSLGDILGTGLDLLQAMPGLNTALSALKVTLGAVAQVLAIIADAADVVAGLVTLDFSRVGNALGFGKSSGTLSNWQRVRMSQDGTLDAYNAWQSGADYGSSRYNQQTGLYTGNYNWEDNADWWVTGRNAIGNANWRGGLTYLGEGGPETAILPRGTRILSAQDTQLMGGDTFYITIDAKNVREFNDIVALAKSARVRRRMEG